MPVPLGVRAIPAALIISLAIAGIWVSSRAPAHAEVPAADTLDTQFATVAKPFIARYCAGCHDPKKQSASLDLTQATTVAAVVRGAKEWELVFDRVHAKEMPPKSAKVQPTAAERAAFVSWGRAVLEREAAKTAGDPGTVLARRLSNAEFDNTVRDLTGVDLRPTREFPVDPANTSGFDNSGESLTMSPALLKKYLAAVRRVADHLVLKPDGIDFAPHPAVTNTDRDRYSVHRIIDFYKRHQVDLANYFEAAWRYQHRAKLGHPDWDLARFATDAKLSAKYLATVWAVLTDDDETAGPLAEVRKAWRALSAPTIVKSNAAHGGCLDLRNLVARLRKPLKPAAPQVSANGISNGSQPFILWRNRALARQRRSYTGNAEGERRDALERFCAVFPDAFFVADRSTNSTALDAARGRPLTAGFHLMQGYFRDDAPLCELVLTAAEKRELDALWFDLDFVAFAPERQYKDFIFFERAEPPRFMFDAEFDFARSEDKDCTSVEKMTKLEAAYLAKARKKKASDTAIAAIKAYFATMSATLRTVEKARLAAEPAQLKALVEFAQRAYRRPLTNAEKADLLAFYQTLRTKGELNHEDAMRDVVASVLLSPHVMYRVDLAKPGAASRPLTDYELASRLSYFLWASIPDAELLARAAAGDLHKPAVLKAQAQRMLRDPKARGLATEFAGNWLDFRRFEEHNAVDRDRFPQFTDDLRRAMFEEPVRYFMDIAARDRSVLDLLYGTDTFVNNTLAKHYGMPKAKGDESEWVRIADAAKFGRGGLLPMAVFQTKNAPGLRTSPVKRGYWVVSKLLGERIPRTTAHCTGIAERRIEARRTHTAASAGAAPHERGVRGLSRPLRRGGTGVRGLRPSRREARERPGRQNQSRRPATFPDGKNRTGLGGLRAYLREKRQADFLDNLTKKLFAYALGRSLLLSDQKQLAAMRATFAADKFAFGSLVESIVTSPQFLHKRGKDDVRE